MGCGCEERREKASEIETAAKEEFNVEKQSLLKQQKDEVKREMEKKEQQLEKNRRINESSEATQMRLELLSTRQSALDDIVSNAKHKLSQISSSGGKKYQDLLKELMLQGARSMNLSRLVVRCRKSDVDVCERAKQNAQSEANSRLGRSVEFTVSRDQFLPPGPTDPSESDSTTCLGGIRLFSTDFRIDCRQTLDDRLSVAYTTNLPQLRTTVFGESSTA
jgi:V-type H+-transporting ATPase subunit E